MIKVVELSLAPYNPNRDLLYNLNGDLYWDGTIITGGVGGATNLAVANRTGTTLDVTSDTGTDATIPEANTTEAGLLTAADKVKLNAITGTNSGDEVSATETVEGIAEIATQAETNAGGDDSRFVTPLKLATWWTLVKTLDQTISGIWTFTKQLILSDIADPGATANQLYSVSGAIKWAGKLLAQIATTLGNSQVVETDGSGNLISAAKGTAYNKSYGSASGTTAQGNDARFDKETLQAMAAMGGAIIAEPVGYSFWNCNQNQSIVAARAVYFAVWIPKDMTITGVKWYQGQQGAYTASDTNEINLYTFSGGTLTKVAGTGNDGNLWKSASGTFVTYAFTGTYAATAGLHFIGMIWNRSAVTTVPIITGLNTTIGSGMDFTNSSKFIALLNTQTALAATTQAMSALTTSTQGFYVALY